MDYSLPTDKSFLKSFSDGMMIPISGYSSDNNAMETTLGMAGWTYIGYRVGAHQAGNAIKAANDAAGNSMELPQKSIWTGQFQKIL